VPALELNQGANRMAYVNPEKPNCDDCNKTGLAILPVRYAVVPKIAYAELPGSLGDKVTNVPLKHHKYALRTLRKGYLYLYYEKHARGRHIKWEVYSVAPGGTLWKQASIDSIQEIVDIRCSNKGHLIPASVITIDTPKKCGRMWMAFSEKIWSAETFKEVEKNISLRNRRMQSFTPADWIEQGRYDHALEATEANVDQIIEYKRGFSFSALGGTDVGMISNPDGTFDRNRLHRCSTVHPVTVRRDANSKLVKMMHQAGESTVGSAYTPLIMSLWDCVGITHELNGFRSDAMGWVKKYNDEREFEADAAAAIEGAKIALAEQAATRSRVNFSNGTFQWNDDATRSRLQLFDTGQGANPVARHREMDLCDRWKQDAAKRVPTHVARQRAKFTALPEPEWRARMAEIDMAAGPIPGLANVAARDARFTQDSHSKKNQAESVIKSWDAYEPRVDRVALNKFLGRRQELVSAAVALSDARTEDVVAWLSSTQLLDAMLEYHDNDATDGEFFTCVVGNMIFGIESSPAGRSLIRRWVDSSSVTDANLLWRCFSLNQKSGNSDLNQVLQVIAKNKETPLTENALAKVKDTIKYIAKLGQLAQKGLSLHNSLRKQEVQRIPTGGIERILVTVGNIFLQPFIRKGLDTLSEALIIALLLTRSGSQHLKITNLLLAMARTGAAGRAENLAAFRNGKAIFSTHFNAQKSAWSNLAKTADIPKTHEEPHLAGGFNEAKELLFGLVATILQGIYFWKLYEDAEQQPNNEKLRAELWASGFSLGAGVADLFATAIKATNPLKDAAISFQTLKLGGSMLSAISAWPLFEQDMAGHKKSLKNGNDSVAYLYWTKGLLNATGGICSVLNGISYAQPAFEMIAKRFPSTFIGRAIGFVPRFGATLAEGLLITRACLLLAGIYISLAVIAIQLIIWYYTDDALQDWCDRCAFGLQRHHRFGSALVQIEEFKNLSKEA
jgi:hypothetical protein